MKTAMDSKYRREISPVPLLDMKNPPRVKAGGG
jgi:hypothetical protein